LYGSEELCLPEIFSAINHYNNNCCHITIGDKTSNKILGRVEISGLLNQKSKDFWQFEKMQNYNKDLYGKALKHDWRAKQFVPLQIVLVSSVNKNSLFKDISLTICMSAFLSNSLSISDNIIYYQCVLEKHVT